jgi:DNA-directed RNA polymerase subunit RPC12/RpoP
MTTPPTTPSREGAAGLICPSCSGVVPVTEGTRIIRCPYCATHSLVQGDRGIQRWQVRRRVDRAGAEAALGGFLTGARKARDLRQQAETREVVLAYLPFWRVDATVAGWLFGRVSSGDDDTKPAEFAIFERMQWNDAALDVGDMAIHRVAVSRADLEPYDGRQLHAEAMVFDPTESATDALEEAREAFVYEAERQAKQETTYFRNIKLLSPILTLAYYPVWIVRYAYRQRTYQVVIDGVSGAVVSGTAPGSTAYRAATLVASLAAGTFLLVNGTILVLATGIGDDDGFGLILAPIVAGLLLILWGYRNFRFGEEVADRAKAYQKAGPNQAKGLMTSFLGAEGWEQMKASGLSALEDLNDTRSKGDNSS